MDTRKSHVLSVCITIYVMVMLILLSCRRELNTGSIEPVKVQINEQWYEAIGDTSHSMKALQSLDTSLTKIIVTAILGQPDTASHELYKYLADTARKALKSAVDPVFKGFNWQQKLGEPMARYEQSISPKKAPLLFTLITDFNYGVFGFLTQDGRDALGIGKEMFFGDYALYDQLSIQNPNFSSYLNRTFNLDHLPAKIMQALASELVQPPSNNRLLDHILAEGKKLYLVKFWMPEIADSILFEWTPSQCAWVEDNELDIWRFLLADKLLYKNSSKDIANLTQPAPHSQGMPPEAPGRAVNYIGYRIIQEYCAREKRTPLQLIQSSDYDVLLKAAKYRP